MHVRGRLLDGREQLRPRRHHHHLHRLRTGRHLRFLQNVNVEQASRKGTRALSRHFYLSVWCRHFVFYSVKVLCFDQIQRSIPICYAMYLLIMHCAC